MSQLQEEMKKEEQRAKVKGVLGLIHLAAGAGVLVKGIIVAVALILGYGSVAYFKGENEVEKIAEEVIELETGITLKMAEPEKEVVNSNEPSNKTPA